MEIWARLMEAHRVAPDGVVGSHAPRWGAFFRGASGHRAVPRSLFVDTEPGTRDELLALPHAGIFRPESFVTGSSGAGNNWAKGHYTEGGERVGDAMAQFEHNWPTTGADVWLVCGLGGGTGGGLGSLLAAKIREQHPSASINVLAVWEPNGVPTAPYNHLLSLHAFHGTATSVVLLDQSAIGGTTDDNYRKANARIARAFEVASRPLRLSDAPVTAADLFAPLLEAKTPRIFGLHAVDRGRTTASLLPATANLSGYALSDGQLKAASVVMPSKRHLDVDTLRSASGWPWSDNPPAAVHDPTGNDGAAAWVAHSGVAGPLQKGITAFESLFRRNAFVNHYTNEGMEPDDFQAALRATKRRHRKLKL